MNRLTVIGRIVRDIELRDIGDGRIVTNNAIAVARTFKTDGGQDTDFIDFVAWNKRAELIEQYCNKGDLVGLDGRLQSRNYLNNKQEKVYVVEMLVETVHFLQPRRNQGNSNQQNNNQTNQNQLNNQNQQNNQNNPNQQNDQQTNNQPIPTANGTKEIQAPNN